jgi:glutamate/tyrosine decarboxylase-like PLP-dependent enzyme
MSLKTYRSDRLGRLCERCCALAQRLAAAIEREPSVELAAPVGLNIVCFRYRAGNDAMQSTYPIFRDDRRGYNSEKAASFLRRTTNSETT